MKYVADTLVIPSASSQPVGGVIGWRLSSRHQQSLACYSQKITPPGTLSMEGTVMASHELRKPCAKCGHTHGTIETKNGQDVVSCGGCGAYQYCAPKTETGRAVRTVRTTHAAVTTSQRWRIIERDGGKCVFCGCRDNLHVDHALRVDAGHKLGLQDSQINSDENLLTACSECNLGKRAAPLPLWLLIPLLVARYKLNGGSHDNSRDEHPVLFPNT
jgi:hypothetical protein